MCATRHCKRCTIAVSLIVAWMWSQGTSRSTEISSCDLHDGINNSKEFFSLRETGDMWFNQNNASTSRWLFLWTFSIDRECFRFVGNSAHRFLAAQPLKLRPLIQLNRLLGVTAYDNTISAIQRQSSLRQRYKKWHHHYKSTWRSLVTQSLILHDREQQQKMEATNAAITALAEADNAFVAAVNTQRQETQGAINTTHLMPILCILA